MMIRYEKLAIRNTWSENFTQGPNSLLKGKTTKHNREI